MDGKAALVTGAASGIGCDLALALGRQGVHLTLADVDLEGARRVARMITKQGGSAQAVACDVSDPAQHLAAFQAHMAAFGRLDYALLNAGISERGDLLWCADREWQATLDVDLRAVIDGVGFAARAMLTGDPQAGQGRGSGAGRGGQAAVQGGGERGVIMITASAGGIFPMPLSPVYAAAKAGCVQLTRSLAPRLIQKGIRICALCPQFTDTALVRAMQPDLAAEVMKDTGGRVLSVDKVTAAGMALLGDATRVGTCLAVLVDGSWVEPQRPRLKPVLATAGAATARPDPALLAWATSGLPASSTRVVEVQRLSTDFRAATRVVQRALPASLPPGSVLIRRLFAGVNASDVNYSAGRYFGSTAAAEKKLPFEAGFEAVGVVAAAAPGVRVVAPGQPVCTMTYGGFAEWAVVSEKHVFPVPEATPQMAALMTSGLTASIALEQAGLRKGQTVLVTAAAGGTGQLAVQLAAMAGCHVIGTCSGGDKDALLRSLGCHRVVNYRREQLRQVLKSEYPRGLDLVYESVGGNMFDDAVAALAPRGQLLIIGMMSQYADGWQPRQYAGIAEKLLWKSASLRGFFLLHHAAEWRRHLQKLAAMLQAGKLKVQMDPKQFVGLESVPDAVEWLQSGQSLGKVYVQIPAKLPEVAHARL